VPRRLPDLAGLLSALGGVYSERLMKHDAKLHSLHLQNMLLYGWGVLFNLFGMFGVRTRTGLDWTGLDWTGLDWTGLDWTGLDLT
jgi:hypothetical protein